MFVISSSYFWFDTSLLLKVDYKCAFVSLHFKSLLSVHEWAVGARVYPQQSRVEFIVLKKVFLILNSFNFFPNIKRFFDLVRNHFRACLLGLKSLGSGAGVA